MSDPTRRFSSRVEDYIRYRPGYPPEILELLRRECGLEPASTVADIGSGTGILSELFLKNGNRVFGVEPNAEMRGAAERLLRHYPAFSSVAGTAEETTLEDRSADFVTAGQAFHWFDRGRARTEFDRILKTGGWIVLVWNERRTDTSIFLAEYERLLQRYSIDYRKVDHRQIDLPVIREFFGPGGRVETRAFDNRQEFDFEGLKGRLLSSSYAPEAGQSGHEEMLRFLETIFQKHHSGGKVVFAYDTRVYLGQFAALGPNRE